MLCLALSLFPFPPLWSCNVWRLNLCPDAHTRTTQKELALGFELCGEIKERFISVVDLMEPVHDGSKDNVFISTSYDATSHFETTFNDINSLYKRVTGHDLDLTKVGDDAVAADGGEAGADGGAPAAE